MSYKLNKVNNFLENIQQDDPVQQVESEIVLSGPDAIKSILLNETVKLNRLETITNELLTYLSDPKSIRKLSYKEKQYLLTTITNIQANSRDFIFRVAETAAKNTFLQEVLRVAQEPREIITSSNGETYVSSIDDETRKNLTEILREVVNERIRNS